MEFYIKHFLRSRLICSELQTKNLFLGRFRAEKKRALKETKTWRRRKTPHQTRGQYPAKT